MSKRVGINAVQFIDALIESPSFKVAIDLWNNGDKQTLRIRLIEWLRTSEEATKTALVQNIKGYKLIDKFEIVPLIRKVCEDMDILNHYKIDNSLTDFERLWFVAMVENDLEKKKVLLGGK